ncbi:MAG: glycosyltransferase [Candidatus Curtissbacteria bacterium]
MKPQPQVSIIIPIFNEESSIGECLKSLEDQSLPHETIVVDDGSSDRSLEIVKNFGVKILKQKHRGPGTARNLGAKVAGGEILVFVDADMTFEKDFVKELVNPILKGDTIGTFSKNEMVRNQDNVWSICWNINKNLPKGRMIAQNHPSHANVFRAIAKSEFEKVGGFEASGQYTDDWSLSAKLGRQSTLAPGAVYYHQNPASLGEIWKQARWIGKNEFISGTMLRKGRSLILYSMPVSILIGLLKSVRAANPRFLAFKLIYDLAVWLSVLKSFAGEAKSR